MKKITFAIAKEAPAMPPKPSTAAIKPMIKSVTTRFNIERVVCSLVVSGLGMALMREDLALHKARAGEVCLWKEVRLTTALKFVYLHDREEDPVIRALVDLLKDVWALRGIAKGARLSGNRRQAAAMDQR